MNTSENQVPPTLITNPILLQNHQYKFLWILGMLWVTFLLIGAPVSLKTFTIFNLEYTVAIIAYPVTYIFSDIFTEVYGYHNSRKMVWTGFTCLIIASFFWYLYSVIPGSSSFQYQEAFSMMFKTVPIILAVSLVAFSLGELVNSMILAKLKIITSGRHPELRYIVSTFFGQLTDNSIFFTGVYLVAGFYTPESILPLIFSSVLFCTLVELLMTPITKLVIRNIKKEEGLDIYDTDTKFNII